MSRSGVINAMTKDELAKVLHTTPQKSDDTAAAQTIAIPAFVTANLSADSVITSACDRLAVTELRVSRRRDEMCCSVPTAATAGSPPARRRGC